MIKNSYAVIMAGGAGTRFWPLSRQEKPKQFLDILGVGKSLLQLTYERFVQIIPKENIYVVTSQKYDLLTKEQLPDLTDDQILLEPFKKNTAPCIAYACAKINSINNEAVIIVSPSDHRILNDDEFSETIKRGIENADDHKLITIGISPTRPETGYGYIQYADTDTDLKRVKTFTEKPNKELAEKFIESGDYLWNAGIFIWKSTAILSAIEEYLPEVHEAFMEMKDLFFTNEEQEGILKVYMQCKNISIDYAIMEKSIYVVVLMGNFIWLDLGHWDAVHDLMAKGEDKNLIQANALLYNVKNSVIMGDKEKLIVLDGLNGYVVADCGNVLLICKKDNEAQMRNFVSDVKKEHGDKFL